MILYMHGSCMAYFISMARHAVLTGLSSGLFGQTSGSLANLPRTAESHMELTKQSHLLVWVAH